MGVEGEGITFPHVVCLPYKVLHKFATCPLEGDGSWQWIKGYVDYEHLELPSGISTPQKWYAYIILTCTDSAMYDTFDEMLDDMNGWKLRQITDLYEIVSQVLSDAYKDFQFFEMMYYEFCKKFTEFIFIMMFDIYNARTLHLACLQTL